MIDRERLLNELAAYQRQKEDFLRGAERCEGALQATRHLLGVLDTEEAEAASAAAGNRNGSPAAGTPVKD